MVVGHFIWQGWEIIFLDWVVGFHFLSGIMVGVIGCASWFFFGRNSRLGCDCFSCVVVGIGG